jgi:hypothetical protein
MLLKNGNALIVLIEDVRGLLIIRNKVGVVLIVKNWLYAFKLNYIY